MLLSGVVRPGRMHDQSAVRIAGIAEQLSNRPDVKATGRVSAPPKKPKGEACDGDKYAWRGTRRRQSSARICVEHTNAELRQGAPPVTVTGRRDIYVENTPRDCLPGL